jgi:arylsulfatase A-like enzyme/Flp pilus assembly protein TadD
MLLTGWKAARLASRAQVGLLGAAALAAILTGCARPHPARSAKGANLLLITIDTVRADHIGVYGYRSAETPTLDRLAATGVRLADASSPAPLTAPAHASILTGLLPPHHGVRNNGAERLAETTPTLATHLAAAGYRTGAFVGAFVLDHRFGFATGFERFDDDIPFDPRAGVDAERPGRVVVDRAFGWLAEPSEKPFFAWVHLYDAHAPYQPPEPYRTRFAGAPYDGEIAEVDHQVGRLMEWLQRSGRTATTVVAVAADHGEALGEHGETTHGLLLYQACLRVPVIVSAPGVLPAGAVVAAPVSLVDLAPTLAAVLAVPLGGPAGPPLDGRDLSAALLAGKEAEATDVYAESRYPATFGWSPLAALRRGALKYIAGPDPELYDLAADPAESSNLVSARGADAAALASRLAALARTTATAPPSAVESRTLARLQSLGYVGSGAGTGAAASGKDPKAMMPLFRAFEAAHWAVVAGKLDAARPELERLVAADAANPAFVAQLAEICREAGDFPRAITLYRRAIELAPGDRNFRYNLGATLLMARQTGDAIAALDTAIALDPLRAEAHNALGMALALGGNLERGREQLVKASELDPHDPRIMNNLGDVLREMKRYDDAERAYRGAIRIDPRDPAPWEGVGTLEVMRNRPALAIADFERALELAPGFHQARFDRGIAEELSGNRPAAIAAYRDFLARAAADPNLARQRQMAEQSLARLEAGAPKP